MDIHEWQEEFHSGPYVYVVTEDGVITNLYETREGANLEIEYRRLAGFRNVAVHKEFIHTDKLARERWWPRVQRIKSHLP